MAGRNNRVIVDVLEATANVMAQPNVALHANQNDGVDELYRLGKFQRNNLHTFKGMYDPRGAHIWLQKIEKIFRVMACTDTQKMFFGTHMISEEAKYWWKNTR
ncbi:unnamed protein product [Lathyrus oleraceus]|uniref:Uncharacterized protein n=1 Tax=Pisum sativum TaxID=3888 RepID=A0A9D4Y268_PEA|nr:hypothetical protein KIW84_035224 [Pisum sativum]